MLLDKAKAKWRSFQYGSKVSSTDTKNSVAEQMCRKLAQADFVILN